MVAASTATTNANVKREEEPIVFGASTAAIGDRGTQTKPISVGDNDSDEVQLVEPVDKKRLVPWLRKLLIDKGEVNIPASAGFWEKSSDYRERATSLNSALHWLKQNSFGRKNGGYRVPDSES